MAGGTSLRGTSTTGGPHDRRPHDPKGHSVIQWDTDGIAEEDVLWLLTPEELKILAPGTPITSIHGETSEYDPGDPPSNGTVYGHLAWGITGVHRKALEWVIS